MDHAERHIESLKKEEISADMILDVKLAEVSRKWLSSDIVALPVEYI